MAEAILVLFQHVATSYWFSSGVPCWCKTQAGANVAVEVELAQTCGHCCQLLLLVKDFLYL
jgi:hypothetical protein